MSEDKSGVYDQSSASPQTEHTTADGEGAGSRSAAGGSKRDPISSSPTIGDTIAGRTVNTGALGDVTNASRTSENLDEESERHSGGSSTGSRGVRGMAGSSEASDPDDGSGDT